MKTTMLTKAMMAVLFAMTSVLTLNAAKPVKITNEEVENGRVSAKVVYEQEGTFLTPEYRFEFRYNDKGQIIEKKSMKWNGTDWINYYCMEVTYTDTEAHIDYSLWNKNKNPREDTIQIPRGKTHQLFNLKFKGRTPLTLCQQYLTIYQSVQLPACRILFI